MTEKEKDAIRAKVAVDNEKLMVGLAPLYLGKWCPFEKEECRGPACQLFQVSVEQTGPETSVVTGGGCSFSLLATQAGPIAGGLHYLASQVADSKPQIVKPPPGLLR